MRNRLYALVGLFLLAVLLGSVPCSVASDSAAGGGVVGAVIGGTPSLGDYAADEEEGGAAYAVTLTFDPNSISVDRGTTAWVDLYVHNDGSSAFTATSCKIKVKYSNGVKEKLGCSLSGSFTVYPGGTVVLDWWFLPGTSAPLGKSTWTVTLIGTVGGTKVKSGSGLEIIYITAPR